MNRAKPRHVKFYRHIAPSFSYNLRYVMKIVENKLNQSLKIYDEKLGAMY